MMMVATIIFRVVCTGVSIIMIVLAVVLQILVLLLLLLFEKIAVLPGDFPVGQVEFCGRLMLDLHNWHLQVLLVLLLPL